MQIETPCPRLPRALARGSDEDFSGGPQEQPLDLLFILARTDRQCARRRVPIPRLAFTWPIPFNLWQNFELFPRSSGMIRLLPFLLLLLSFSVQAQKQLVLLKRGKPVGNFQEGVYIYLQLKDGTRSEGHIVELLEFTIITSNDTIYTLISLIIHCNLRHFVFFFCNSTTRKHGRDYCIWKIPPCIKTGIKFKNPFD